MPLVAGVYINSYFFQLNISLEGLIYDWKHIFVWLIYRNVLRQIISKVFRTFSEYWRSVIW